MWNIDKARDTYSLAHWGGGYFDVGAQGHLMARPSREPQSPAIDLHALAEEIQQAGLALPVLVRFTDILHDRVDSLSNAFETAKQGCDYAGRYTAVYPIKVNQQQSVVREILRHGGPRVGLEAGSKPELMAVLALSRQDGGVIVCNGYKDREYIRLALMGQRLGLCVYIVLEKPSELELVIEESRQLAVRPQLGVRVRLASIGRGNWQNTGGEKSKFGLSAGQVLHMVERLHETGLLDSLCLLHCHMGSQLANIRDIQHGMREVARYYAELHALGVTIRCVDVGGGLGIDYEGTRSRSVCSINYSLQEYANKIVHTLAETCQERGLPTPDIITESGRAMTAHHAMLITEVIEVEQPLAATDAQAPDADAPSVLHDLWQGLGNLAAENARAALEIYHDAVQLLAEAQSLYVHGMLNLAQKAQAEALYVTICQRVRQRLNPSNRSHREILDELNEKLADKYFCNFSLFQSLPDVWAIEQIFPIAPLNRLDEAPGRRGTLQDITCDSDGRIDLYVDSEGIETSLPLHELKAGEPYRLGIFLVGAYQEILGDMHNLFGDTNAVNVSRHHGGYRLEQLQEGDTVDEVLRYVHFDIDALTSAYHAKITQADLTPEQQQAYLTELTASLQGYTYLEE
jgi:arginine decarboxylase